MDDNEHLPGPNWSQDEIQASRNGPLHPAAIRGIHAFNQGDYFEAHEHLETAWRDERGPVREIYRGILQIGLAYFHILRGNYRGALKMFRRSKPWLAPFPEYYRGIDVERIRSDADQAETELRILGEERVSAFNPAFMRPINFETHQ